MEICGTYNKAIIYADELENGATGQIKTLCSQKFCADSKIRVMPDAHAGAGCVIGTTMTIKDKIVPNLVGVDIGCGIELVNLGKCRMDFRKLDTVIHESVPSAFALRKDTHRFALDIELQELTCAKILNHEKAKNSIGTLGGGNHFIEIDKDESNGNYYLLIHSGSRNPGLQVATHHQKIAGEFKRDDSPYELSWLEGEQFQNYIHDMLIMQNFALLNRRAIADVILKGMKWKAEENISTIHNYLDLDSMILRKGAVSAKKDELLVIPLNMRDGSLICRGKGNPDWNFSAPHGAGRIYSRTDAKNKITLTQFKQAMEGIYSSCVNRSTIDESPQAYKPYESIMAKIGDTVDIITRIKPVYNFKAGKE